MLFVVRSLRTLGCPQAAPARAVGRIAVWSAKGACKDQKLPHLQHPSSNRSQNQECDIRIILSRIQLGTSDKCKTDSQNISCSFMSRVFPQVRLHAKRNFAVPPSEAPSKTPQTWRQKGSAGFRRAMCSFFRPSATQQRSLGIRTGTQEARHKAHRTLPKR